MYHQHTCYLNGEFIPYNEVNLHISDLLIQRGYGVFDFFRARNGEIPWLNDYIERLFKSLRLSEIQLDLSPGQFEEIIAKLYGRNQLENGAFKVIVTGGFSETLESVTGEPNIIILNVPWNRPPSETFTEGVNLVSLEFVRPNPQIKTLNYFNTIRLRNKLSEYDAIDVLFHNEYLSEASRANIFCVKDGRVTTPVSNILFGVTRKQILSLFPEIEPEDTPTTQLYDLDELFIASTSRDITPVVQVQGRKIGSGKPGKFTKMVQAAFREQGWMLTGIRD